MMIAVVFSTIIASSFIKANAAETEKAVTFNPRRKYFSTRYSTGSCGVVAADNTQAVITLNKDFEGAGAVVKKIKTLYLT